MRKTIYCDAIGCNAEATHKVKVSEKKFGDSRRNYCDSCYDVFCVGLQHARTAFASPVKTLVGVLAKSMADNLR